MNSMIPAYYYAQQGADNRLPHPGLGFGGWGKTEIEIDWNHTAIIVMHAWDVPKSDAISRVVEYMGRADKIMQDGLIPFVQWVREKGLRLIHIGGGFEAVLDTIPSYQRVARKYPRKDYPAISCSEFQMKQRQRHWELTGGADRIKDAELENCYPRYRFAIEPLEHEDMAVSTNQLVALCKEYQIEHLIYTGFAVNACLTMSPCGFVDMHHHGLMCSVVGDLTTAVENKESCAEQTHLRYGLWQFAVQSGYVFLSEEIKESLED